MQRSEPIPCNLAWHHLALALPPGWEVVGYSKDPDKGRLALADPSGETLQLFWSRVTGPPQLDHRLTALVEANAPARFSPREARKWIRRVGAWQAFVPPDPDLPVFAGLFLETKGILLNATFPPRPGEDHRPAARRVLESCRPNDGPDRRWCAFGLDIDLPADYALESVTPMPAAQTLRFEHRRGYTVTAGRHAFLSRLLRAGSLESVFARIKGGGIKLFKDGPFLKDDRHPGVKLVYSTRGAGGTMSLLARPWDGLVWVWRCDDSDRLFYLDHHVRRGQAIPDLLSRVRCP